MWQRVFLVELDGTRVRHISVLIAGEAGDERASWIVTNMGRAFETHR